MQENRTKPEPEDVDVTCYHGFITTEDGYSRDMTVTDRRPTRIAGVEVGTAVLAATTTLAFSIAIAVLTQSAAVTLLAGSSLLVGLGLVLAILPSVE